MNYQDFLDFWFSPAAEPNWFVKSAEFDALLAEKFTDVLQQAAQGELWTWRETPAGRLAEIIVLDQLSRNLYRNDPRAVAQDVRFLGVGGAAGRGDVQEPQGPASAGRWFGPRHS